jgi:GNAT superfamily N-acetyltransferase
VIEIDHARPGELDEVRAAFREYAKWLGVNLAFQGDFEKELESLPGKYAPPSGRLLVARATTGLAGTCALRSLGDGFCEMKRLFVREAYRRQSLGRRLVERLLAEARAIGYGRMRLDTLAHMTEAVTLYQSCGFHVIPAYYHNPLPDVVYLELDLMHEPRPGTGQSALSSTPAPASQASRQSRG